MKIISIIGSSSQKVLLPLLQYPKRFDSAVFIVQKSEQEAYSYIKSFLDEKRDRTGREFRYREVPEINSPDYDSFYDTVAGLLWESFAGNEKAVLNISGGTSYMILAGVQAAKAMNDGKNGLINQHFIISCRGPGICADSGKTERK